MLPSSLAVVRLLLSRGADWSIKSDDEEAGTAREQIKAKVGRREFQSLQNLADSVPVSPPSLSSAIREGIQGSRIRFVLGCVIPRAGAVARSRNLGQALFGSPVVKRLSVIC